MRKGYTRVYAEIDLDAVVFNMKSMKKSGVGNPIGGGGEGRWVWTWSGAGGAGY